MPRKNRHTPHVPFARSLRDQSKRRFTSQQQAEQVANERMILIPHLELYVYKGIDGGWYLTSHKP